MQTQTAAIASWLVQVAIYSTLGVSCCVAAEQYCDSALRRDAAYPLGYQQRGDRCEGVYIREVSGRILEIASFTSRFEDLDPKAHRAVPLHWIADGPEPVHVRAVDLREKLYYRMDTLRPSGEASYEWPSDILAALRLRKRDLGVMAWITRELWGQARAVYLPIAVGRGGGEDGRYDLILLPGRALNGVYLTIAPLRADGTPAAPVVNGREVRSGYWPAGAPLRMALPTLPQRGLHYLEIGAPLSGGGSATAEIWFYNNAGARR